MLNPREIKTPQAYISARSYIKWSDNPAGENTDTLVLTTPQKHYVDLRILLPLPIPPQSAALEWAFAGTSTTTLPTSTSPQHSKWSHWVDSKHPLGVVVEDEGDMYPQSDGDTLETGSMVNPTTGKYEKYEERWFDLDVEIIENEKKKIGWVMRTHDEGSESVRGMVVRVGQYVQGILKSGEKIGVERWVFDGEKKGWKSVATSGEGLHDVVPKLLAWHKDFEVNDVYHDDSVGDWKCVEAFEW